MYSIDLASQVDQIKDGPTRALRRFSAVPAMYSIDLVSQVDQIKDGPTRALRRFSAVPAMYSIDFASQIDQIKDGPTRALRPLDLISEEPPDGSDVWARRVPFVALSVFLAFVFTFPSLLASEIMQFIYPLTLDTEIKLSTYSYSLASGMEQLRLGPKRSVETNIHQNKIL